MKIGKFNVCFEPYCSLHLSPEKASSWEMEMKTALLMDYKDEWSRNKKEHSNYSIIFKLFMESRRRNKQFSNRNHDSHVET